MLVARHLGAMISLLRIPENALVQLSSRRGPVGSRALVTRVRYFESDGSVFVDDAYLIKGVAGRVLWRVLSTYVEEHRDEFSNREIRLDAQVGLPALNDNLEARLIALRRRLEERCTPLRIERIERGRFRLEVDRELILERRD
jgi:adenylate cyclase